MINRDFKPINNIIRTNLLGNNFKTLGNKGFSTVFDNESFCNNIMRKNSVADGFGFYPLSSIVYQNAKSNESESYDIIINLLMQLRACQNDQNGLLRSKTAIQQQVFNQLEKELLFVNDNITINQLNELKNDISNNLINNKSFDKIINRVSSIKKKLEVNQLIKNVYTGSESDINILSIANKNLINNANIENNLLNRYEKLTNSVVNRVLVEKNLNRENLINLNKESVSNEYNEEELNKTNNFLNKTTTLLQKIYDNNVLKVQENLTNLINKEVLTNNTSIENRLINSYEKLTNSVVNRALTKTKLNRENLVNLNKESVLNEYNEEQLNLINNVVNRKNLINLNKESISNEYNEEELNKTNNFLNKTTTLLQKIYDNNVLKVQENLTKLINKEVLTNSASIESRLINSYEKLTGNVVNRVFSKVKVNRENLITLNKENDVIVSNDIIETLENRYYNSVVKGLKPIISVENKNSNTSMALKKLNYFYNNISLPDEVLYDVIYNFNKKISKTMLEDEVININKRYLGNFSRKENVHISDKVYYNDAVEQIGQEQFLYEDIVSEDRKTEKDIFKDNIIYKNPINLSDIKSDIDESIDVLKSQEISNEKAFEQRERHFENNKLKRIDNVKGMSEVETRKMIEGYMKEIDVDRISKEVMSNVERTLRTERRRIGIN